jgi:hypothetical protein
MPPMGVVASRVLSFLTGGYLSLWQSQVHMRSSFVMLATYCVRHLAWFPSMHHPNLDCSDVGSLLGCCGSFLALIFIRYQSFGFDRNLARC